MVVGQRPLPLHVLCTYSAYWQAMGAANAMRGSGTGRTVGSEKIAGKLLVGETFLTPGEIVTFWRGLFGAGGPRRGADLGPVRGEGADVRRGNCYLCRTPAVPSAHLMRPCWRLRKPRLGLDERPCRLMHGRPR